MKIRIPKIIDIEEVPEYLMGKLDQCVDQFHTIIDNLYEAGSNLNEKLLNFEKTKKEIDSTRELISGIDSELSDIYSIILMVQKIMLEKDIKEQEEKNKEKQQEE